MHTKGAPFLIVNGSLSNLNLMNISKISIRRSKTYKEILDLQEEAFNERIDCKKECKELPDDLIFFVEHNPVYTLGKHGKFSHLLVSEAELLDSGIEYARIGRGGDITYHGPGQLTVYPILDLQRYSLGVKDYVNFLEEVVIRTINEFGIKGERIEGKTGVWIGKNSDRERKISAIGIKCSRFVTMHGIALNVGSDISGFSGIVPCGLPNDVTSISLEVGREIALDDAEQVFWKNFISLLQLRIPSQGNS